VATHFHRPRGRLAEEVLLREFHDVAVFFAAVDNVRWVLDAVVENGNVFTSLQYHCFECPTLLK
jgi:hypothetical protein